MLAAGLFRDDASLAAQMPTVPPPPGGMEAGDRVVAAEGRVVATGGWGGRLFEALLLKAKMISLEITLCQQHRYRLLEKSSQPSLCLAGANGATVLLLKQSTLRETVAETGASGEHAGATVQLTVRCRKLE